MTPNNDDATAHDNIRQAAVRIDSRKRFIPDIGDAVGEYDTQGGRLLDAEADFGFHCKLAADSMLNTLKFLSERAGICK